MAIFNYLTKDSEGKRKEGELRADSLDTAIQKLSANGQMVISLKETDDTFDFLGPFIDEIQLSTSHPLGSDTQRLVSEHKL